MWDISSPTRDRSHVPCIGRWIPNHWATMEVPLRRKTFQNANTSFYTIPSFKKILGLTGKECVSSCLNLVPWFSFLKGRVFSWEKHNIYVLQRPLTFFIDSPNCLQNLLYIYLVSDWFRWTHLLYELPNRINSELFRSTSNHRRQGFVGKEVDEQRFQSCLKDTEAFSTWEHCGLEFNHGPYHRPMPQNLFISYIFCSFSTSVC